jgi:hypothetical protein
VLAADAGCQLALAYCCDRPAPSPLPSPPRQVYSSPRNIDDDLVRSISLPAQDANAPEVFYRIITARGEAMNRLLDRLQGTPLFLLWGSKVWAPRARGVWGAGRGGAGRTRACQAQVGLWEGRKAFCAARCQGHGGRLDGLQPRHAALQLQTLPLCFAAAAAGSLVRACPCHDDSAVLPGGRAHRFVVVRARVVAVPC